MLDAIIEWSARNRFLVVLATLFVTLAGVCAVMRTPLDALPDLSDVQVIIYTEAPGQAPQVVEDQVTYPLTTAMLSVPKSKVVRGFSFFGASFVYVIFDDGTDIYWARSRVLEYLNFAAGRLPKGVTPQLGPDATSVGWVYQHAVLARDRTLAELRTIQDWFVRYQLTKAHGVAEVASVGGRALEMAETEYMVRGRGCLRGAKDLESLVVKADKGTPVLIRDVARVELGPDERRGLTELDDEGEAVSAVVMSRYGQNALEVIHNVKARMQEIASGLPEGVTLETVYDRSELIHRAIETLKSTLIEESVIVALVCVVFLMHVRSALVAILMLPVGVLIAFIAMHALGMNSNIMSLGGIAIAAMVDACREVGPALFFSLLIITVSFLPVFTLESQEGRLFSPLGSEFMPTLNEGTLFYMPASLPGMSITKAAELLQTQDKIIRSFPEVASVYGKAGRANTATDPAPTEMFETVINLKPEREWRAGMTIDKLVSELDRALQFPGVSNAWTMPIKARIDMLSTGIRTPIGIKVFGKRLDEMERLAKEIEAVVKQVPGTSSAFAERITGGYYLEIEPERSALARYGLAVGGIWLMWWLGYNLSVAVAVGFIALAGVAAETGVVMLICLDHAWEALKRRRAAGAQPPTTADLYAAIMEGAVERVRPKMMTVVAIMAGLLPIMWSHGTGSEVMSRIAAPMVGGMISSTLLTLIVIPALHGLVKEWRLRRGWERPAGEAVPSSAVAPAMAASEGANAPGGHA